MSLHVNQSGIWTPVDKLHVHSGGAFVPVKKAFVNQAGTWHEYFTGESGPPVGDPEPIFEHGNIRIEYAMHWQDESNNVVNTASSGEAINYGIINPDGTIVTSDKFTSDFFSGANGSLVLNEYPTNLTGDTINFWVKWNPLSTDTLLEAVSGENFYIAYDPVAKQIVVHLQNDVENFVYVDYELTENHWEMITVSFGTSSYEIEVWVGNMKVANTLYDFGGSLDQTISLGNGNDCYVSRFRYFTTILASSTIDVLWNDGNGF